MSKTPESLTGTSMDIPTENRARLKQLFPTVFTETLDDSGELVESVDFERLKAELGTFTDLFESRRERYGMDWPGKKDALRLIQTPSAATLKPCREESVNFDTTENLFIEGDNLEVLKLLQKSYYGKIKMIYIDPPYNTGKEFIYPDNFKENLDTYLEYAGLIDGDGKKFSTNTANEGRFHTKWMNMMYPRLYLARNLLKDDGVIFISIDDNEVTNLRKICDEIFGEENFIDPIIWKKRYGGGAKEKFLVALHEYSLVYAKSITDLADFYIPLDEESIKRYYVNRDSNYESRGPFRTHPLEAMKSFDLRENLNFSITAPNGEEIWPVRQWRWGQERVVEARKNNEIEYTKGKDGKWVLYSKQYLKNEDGEIRKTKPFSIIEDVYTQHGTNEIVKILGDAKYFDFPKPSLLLEKLITIGLNYDHDSIVLDFFSGSCTTAHAVISLNKKDNGNRKFIMVQLPEPCDQNSEAFKAGYKTIADIGKERIRRAINQMKESPESSSKPSPSENNKLKQQTLFDDGIPQNNESGSTQTALESTVNNLDLGFKVLKLDKSNFKQWQKLDPATPPEKIEKQLELFVEHIEPKASQEDLLYEILIKAGFMPTTKISILELKDGKLSDTDEKTSPEPSSLNVFSVENGALLLCLEKTITKELIDAVADCEPMQFICLDAAFNGNDQLKANAVQTFAARNMQREKHNQIVFKTV